MARLDSIYAAVRSVAVTVPSLASMTLLGIFYAHLPGDPVLRLACLKKH